MKHGVLNRTIRFFSILVMVFTLGCTTSNMDHQHCNVNSTGMNFMGVWRVTYSNNYIRNYKVDSEDRVLFLEESRQAILQRGNEVLLKFNDGKIERWRIHGNHLLVEHWNPASGYPKLPPTETGVGIRVN